jgi:maleylpyruvate isomerase
VTLRLWNYWRSSSSWRVRIGLHWKGLPFEYRPVNLLGGEQFGPDHQGRNPMSQVPVLEVEDGGRTMRLAQSMAILEWLDERHPAPALLPPDPEGRARVRMLAEHVNSGIQPYQNAVVLKWLRERVPGGEREWAARFIGRGLDALEATARDGAGRFCHGDAPTLADVYLVPQLFGARRFGVDVSRFPTLLRVEEACRALDAFARSEPERQPDAPPPEERRP